MGGGDDPPPYQRHDTAGTTTTEDAQLASRRATLRVGAAYKMLGFLGLAFLLLIFFQSTEATELGSGKTSAVKDINVREQTVDTGHKALKAQLDLYDLLSIRSWSGSVNVGIRTHPADEEHSMPAKLAVTSHSGKVKVDMPAANAPIREYDISIETHSASISGNLLLSGTTSVLSHSGRVTIQVTACGATNDSSTLSTSTESGKSDITVLTSTVDTTSSTKQLSSTHTTRSGSLTLRYPKEWEGIIEGHSQSGKVRLYGSGIQIIQQDRYYVLAKKGTGNSKLSFQTASGGASVHFE